MRPADAYRQKHRVVDREEGAPLQSLPQREEGSSLQRLDASAAAFDPVRGERQFSVLSKNALSTLDGLVGEVDKLENLLVDLEKMVGAPDDADRLAALGSVRQIVGDLDKLQALRRSQQTKRTSAANELEELKTPPLSETWCARGPR